MASALFDSSAIIAAFNSTEPSHRACVSAMGAVPRSMRSVSVVTRAEVMTGAYSHSSEAVERVGGMLADAIGVVEPVSEEIADTAAQLRADNPSVKLPDALIVATGQVLGVGLIFTTDKKMTRLDQRVKLLT